MGKLSPKCIKILKTLTLYVCFFLQGLGVAITGPCLLDLAFLVNTDLQHIGTIFVSSSVGYLVGGLIGGMVLDATRFKQFALSVISFIGSLTIFGIPWSTNLGMLNGLIFGYGLMLSAADVGGNVICLTLWGSENGPYFQALHLAFSLGSLSAPLIAAPFLGDYRNISVGHNLTYSNFTGDFTNTSAEFLGYVSPDPAHVRSNMTYVYCIIFALYLLNSVMFLTMSIIQPMEEEIHRNINSKDQGKGTNFGFLFPVVVLNTLFLFVVTGVEMGYPQMLTTYVVKSHLQLPSSVGSYMTSAFFATLNISRFASVFLVMKFSNFTLLVYNMGLLSVGSLVLLFLSSYEWAIWLSSLFLGAGVAPVFPAVVSWLDSYINVTSKIAAVFNIGGGVSVMVIPFIIGYFIETIPDVLIYTIFVLSVLSCLAFVLLYLILRKREKKDINIVAEYSEVRDSNAST